nr:MAG TPA: hypothetical protein [Caudoviricetes sp.]
MFLLQLVAGEEEQEVTLGFQVAHRRINLRELRLLLRLALEVRGWKVLLELMEVKQMREVPVEAG